MAKVKITNLFEVDLEASTKAFHETMVQFTKDTLVEWVIHTTQPIPVWSGAARATFIKLANQVQFNVDVSPITSPPSVGDRTLLGVDNSSGTLIAKIPNYGWDWESTLEYIDIVEGRSRFLEAGERAIADRRPQLPQPIRKTPGRSAK